LSIENYQVRTSRKPGDDSISISGRFDVTSETILGADEIRVRLSASDGSEIWNESINVSASDLNKDKLDYVWKLDGKEVSTTNSYTYSPSYSDAGSHTVKVVITDGVKTAENLWSVTVENVNRKPVIEKIEPLIPQLETINKVLPRLQQLLLAIPPLPQE